MNPHSGFFRIFATSLFVAIYLAAPLLGAVIVGHSPESYLEFPPRTTATGNSPFSWPLFLGFLLFVVLTTRPFWKRMARVDHPFSHGGNLPRAGSGAGSFPAWGWVSIAGIALFWTLIWSRADLLASFQRLLFFPLWLSFIFFLNALSLSRCGKSLATGRPLFFSLLFPASALFWWSFEYLNRFVNNWHYVGIGDLGAGQYFLEATLAFSTVLPAVMSIRFLLMQFRIFQTPFRDFHTLPLLTNGALWTVAGILSLAGLTALGMAGTYVYPLVWILPGLLWISLQKLNGYTNPLLKQTAAGDYTLVWSSACAALICGFFWEMWNVNSAAKWIYSIPGVDRFHIFEMPLIGYAGYLPFGIVCALISNSLLNTLAGKGDEIEETSLTNGTGR